MPHNQVLGANVLSRPAKEQWGFTLSHANLKVEKKTHKNKNQIF